MTQPLRRPRKTEHDHQFIQHPDKSEHGLCTVCNLALPKWLLADTNKLTDQQFSSGLLLDIQRMRRKESGKG